MSNRIRINAVAAAAIGAAGILAAPGNAANPTVKAPKIKSGTLTVVGTDGADRIALRLKAGEPGTLQVDVGDDGTAEFSFPRAAFSRIAVDALGGDDAVRIDEANGVFTDTAPETLAGGAGNDTLTGGAGAGTLRGGTGDDTLVGGAGAETLDGGVGNDAIDGNRGNDSALMGAGDDTFTWDPGDGSDTIEGQDGADTMRFNGANVNEHVDLSANGKRLRFFRDVGNVTMDTRSVEQVDFQALGGTDVVHAGDLTGTEVKKVDVDLGTDGASDQVIVDGTNRNDAVNVTGDATGVAVSGLAALVSIQHQEPSDGLTVNGLGGNDAVSAATLADPSIKLVVDGGAGNDTIAGGRGADTLLGGDGDDAIDGNQGTDVALMGAGDDTFTWDPGDGSDIIEGQAGADTMRFNGANVNERMDVSANGGRVRFTRDVGNIVIDLDDVERIVVNALGGADQVTTNDLAGTDVTRVDVDLAGTGGTGDGAADQVVVNGTNGADAVVAAGDSTGVGVLGLAAGVNVTHAEAANDRLTINGLAGDDLLQASGLTADAILLTLDGGAGDDILIGGAGDDTLFGREGDDVLIGGPGLDILDGGPGNNILIQD